MLLLWALPLAAYTQVTFVKVTDPNNPIVNFTVSPTQLYVGAAWVDFDNDGDIDLFAAPNRLFENLGSGSFQSKSSTIGSGNILSGSWYFYGTTWADVENDGDIDCMLAGNKVRFYLNDGSGTFTEQPQSPFNSEQISIAAAFGDYNADGWVDAAIASPAGPGTHGFVFSSSGPLSWQSVGGIPFTESNGSYTVPTWADFDDDGDFDLFVASGPAIQAPALPDYIYRNKLVESGAPTLEPITDIPFATTAQDGQCYNFIDYDNNGTLDICLTNYKFAPNRLYKNNGDGTYSSITTPFTNTSIKNCLSNVWGDFDNDGDLDVIITRDNSNPALHYENDGTGVFTLATGSAINQHLTSMGASLGDYDNDGDLDAFLNSRTDVSPKGKALFRNDLNNGNHWVAFKLVGTTSNRSAIGAKMRILVTIGGQAKWLRRDVSAQNAFQGQNDLRLHFGLGDAQSIDSLVVTWPSGAVTTCGGVGINQYFEVAEVNGSWEQCAVGIPEIWGKERLSLTPNPAGDAIQILLPPGIQAQPSASITIFDTSGQIILQTAFSENLLVGQLLPGMYTLRLQDGSRIWSGKFLKQ